MAPTLPLHVNLYEKYGLCTQLLFQRAWNSRANKSLVKPNIAY